MTSKHGVGFRRDDSRWHERLEQVVAFRAEHGFLPSQTPAAPVTERRMSYWLSAQRSDAAALALPRERQEWLDTSLPGWQDRQPPHRRAVAREH